MSEIVLKAAPTNVDAERALLGCIINDIEKFQEIEGKLVSDDFYVDKHKAIFQAIAALSRRDIRVDLVTLLEELNSKKRLEMCGGVTYISNLSTEAVYNDNVYAYSKIIKDKANRRRIISAARELIENVHEDKTIDEVLGNLEDKIQQTTSKNNEEIKSISTAVDEVLIAIERNYQNGGAITGKTTGFKELDECLSGLNKGNFMVVAARPSMGKTAFALNIGQYASRDAKVAMFSLEMNSNELMQRLLASRCLVELQAIKTGKLNDDEFAKIANGANKLATRDIYIDDRATSISDIKSKCRTLKKKNGLDIVIIDYLQLIESSEKSQSREQEIAKISRELKKMAMSLGITVIALSQLSRAPEQRADHRPMLSDLRESGSIEQDTDVVMFLYRDEYYNKESEEKNIAEVIVAKNRNGEVKTIKLGWAGKYQRFARLDLRG